MFVNAQDITLLHGALMSAARLMPSKGHEMDEPSQTHSIHLKDKEGAVDIVSSTIIKLTQDTSKVKNGMEFLKMQLHLNRRLHSVIFFVALRSNDITCSEANNFFQSIPHTFPSMDWMFYLKLNYQCNWSEYFIECARQLQPDILASIIKSLLPLYEEDHLVHYAWHLSLQSTAWKFFHLDDPAIMQHEQHLAFDFQFEDLGTTPPPKLRTKEEAVYFESPPKSKLLHAFVTVLNHMLLAPKTEFTFAKVVLHFYKTVFKLLGKCRAECSVESVKELFRMNPLLEKCFGKEPSSQSAIESFLRVPENSLLSHCYVNASWDVCAGYLLFLVLNYWRDAENRVDSSSRSSAFLQMISIPIKKEVMFQIRPPFCADGHDLRLLKAIIRYDYPFASRAAELLLLDPDIRTTTEIINILKEHASKLSPMEIYPLLADAIVESNSTDIKNTFLNLFFHVLSNASCNIYNVVLYYIFDRYGINEHFKLPDADSHLIQFTRKTMLLDEAKKCLLPLFLQMPLTVLKTLIEQALIRGAEGIAIIPVLKHIPSVCYHKNNFQLLEELSHYFLRKDLQTHVEKNFVNLIESVMVVQTEENILSFDKFLELCILPCFSKKIRIDLTLECLNVSLKILTDKAALNLSSDSFFSLMESLTLLLDDCTKLGNGKRKELVLLTLSILGENKEFHERFSKGSPHFIKHLSNLKEVVVVYLKPFYEKETYEDTVDVFGDIYEPSWIYCCQSEDPKLEFKKRLYSLRMEYEYDTLLSILVPLLSHFTMKEWIQSAYFLKEYFKHFSPYAHFSSLPSLLPKSDPIVYSVVRTLMECYSILLKISSCDKQYVSSCFTNTVMNVLSQDSHPQLLLNVFIDACHITSISEIDSLHLLSSFLINIKKCICLACKDKLLQANYLKLALTSVKCLPDSEAKSSLLQKF